METNADMDLPAEVIAAIRARRQIEAIKLLREHWGMGLKEAKQAVDAYVRSHPEAVMHQPPRTESGIGRLVLAAGILIAVYLAYNFFS